MHTTKDMNYYADGPRAFALDRYFLGQEYEKAFRRMRRIAFRDSVRRLIGRLGMTLWGQSSTSWGQNSIPGGQSWRGRRATDPRKTLGISLDSIDGYIEPDGRISIGRKGFSARLLPRWRAILEKGGADSLPPPRACRLGGKWYLESSLSAIFALEAAHALGAAELRAVVPSPAMEAAAGAVRGRSSRGDRAA